MNYPIVARESMLIAGIDVFTSNEQEFSGEGKIPALWSRFFSEDILAQIPNRVDDVTLVAAYTDIESDENGRYRFVIGTEVSTFEGIPEAFFRGEIPAATYAEFTTEQGPFSKVGLACWQRIWADDTLKARRRYDTDLEIYDLRNMAPESVQFKICVGVAGGTDDA
ncbi:AraC family transcriptional regulator [Natronospirillum operosum]|uniref:AraC family transcriptional regulator n=1 Tax=Natronospirillum operosum TaxID=2759953 RepID=A0A4Z0WD59_9GAMM|nr:GyrI-like domain-containing protein [Natronospirillum operosum]TGG92874.1 AraC family transcriptional regulator [Natronospirillum operosum]